MILRPICYTHVATMTNELLELCWSPRRCTSMGLHTRARAHEHEAHALIQCARTCSALAHTAQACMQAYMRAQRMQQTCACAHVHANARDVLHSCCDVKAWIRLAWKASCDVDVDAMLTCCFLNSDSLGASHQLSEPRRTTVTATSAIALRNRRNSDSSFGRPLVVLQPTHHSNHSRTSPGHSTCCNKHWTQLTKGGGCQGHPM